jgi:hypothetical protein
VLVVTPGVAHAFGVGVGGRVTYAFQRTGFRGGIGKPFGKVLVFALLTYIADPRGPDSVIFAMEEPEIALSPHTQRRMTGFVTRTMGRAIVASHSPCVIERFDPDEVVVLNHDGHLRWCYSHLL